jgi:3-oxoacyl-[acyl-carrier-protein] synthase II
MLLGEGAGFVVLESRRSAERRGAPIHAVIAGYGLSCDARHLATPDGTGRGAAAAMCMALRSAGLDPAEIDYVSAHGTGTPANDDVEARVLAELFPSGTRVNSTKSLLGHTLGASGAIEALVAALTLRHGVAHPSRNLDDPEVPLAFVRETGPVAARYAVSESFAFGGQNAVLALAAVS